MPDEITEAGQAIVDMLGACAADPDDLATARAADEALLRLERLLADHPTGAGGGQEPATADSSTSQKGSSR